MMRWRGWQVYRRYWHRLPRPRKAAIVLFGAGILLIVIGYNWLLL